MKINSLVKSTAINKITPAVRILLVVNVALFLLDRLIPYKMTEILGLYLPVNEKFAVWQYLTGMFMHHGVMHLIINMAGLFFFGCMVERTLGSKRFVTLYGRALRSFRWRAYWVPGDALLALPAYTELTESRRSVLDIANPHPANTPRSPSSRFDASRQRHVHYHHGSTHKTGLSPQSARRCRCLCGAHESVDCHQHLS